MLLSGSGKIEGNFCFWGGDGWYKKKVCLDRFVEVETMKEWRVMPRDKRT